MDDDLTTSLGCLAALVVMTVFAATGGFFLLLVLGGDPVPPVPAPVEPRPTSRSRRAAIPRSPGWS
jgi:hypothetical protein